MVTGPKSERVVKYLVTTLVLFAQSLVAVYPGVYIAKVHSGYILFANLGMTIIFLIFYLTTSAKNPGILERGNLPPPEDDSHRPHLNIPKPDGLPQIEEPSNLNQEKKKIPIKGGNLYEARYCVTCKIMRPPLASHCSECDNCVVHFDHHCGWVGNCIGGGTHRQFIAMLISGTLSCIHSIIQV